MKKMLVIIVILAMILVSMIIYKNIAINKNKSVNVQEVEQIEEYISKIYMWKEITKEALPTFENINNANELWLWEVIKKNLETYETTYEEIQQKGKELFGEKFEKQIPKEGNDSFYYDKESNKYLATEIVLDEEEDSFLLKDIEKEGEKYKVKIIEYIEDYSEENKVIIRNLQEEEIGRVSTSDSETKIKEIVGKVVKNNSGNTISLTEIEQYREYSEFKSSTFKPGNVEYHNNGQVKQLSFEFKN